MMSTLLQGLTEKSGGLCVISVTNFIHRTAADLGARWQVNKSYLSPQPEFRIRMRTFSEAFLAKNSGLIPCLPLHLQSKMYGHLTK